MAKITAAGEEMTVIFINTVNDKFKRFMVSNNHAFPEPFTSKKEHSLLHNFINEIEYEEYPVININSTRIYFLEPIIHDGNIIDSDWDINTNQANTDAFSAHLRNVLEWRRDYLISIRSFTDLIGSTDSLILSLRSFFFYQMEHLYWFFFLMVK